MTNANANEVQTSAELASESDIERQEYLDNTHIESYQFGVGRLGDEYSYS